MMTHQTSQACGESRAKCSFNLEGLLMTQRKCGQQVYDSIPKL